MWGDNGITNKRVILDQSANVAWGASFLRVPTRAFNQVGYLRRLLVKLPVTAAQFTITAANQVAVGVAANNPAFRAMQSVDITAQGIAPLYQLGRGVDLSFLSFVRNGRKQGDQDALGVLAQSTYTNTATLGRPGAADQGFAYAVNAQTVGGAAVLQNLQFGAVYDLPLTEWVRFPASTVQGPHGPVSVAAQEVEVGLITLQNTQQNVVPHLTLNPLYSAGTDSPFLQAATAPAAGQSLPAEVDFWTEFYDVPASPADQPPAYAQAFIISRTSVDDAISGGSVTHNFQPAGMLMRAIYTFYDVNGNLVDVSQQGLQTITSNPPSTQATEGTITFRWGATVIKLQERFTVNLLRAASRYGDVPPIGCLIHDFFEERTVTDLVNTATLTSVQTQVTGLPAAATTMHTIEERMIPVRLG